MWIEVRTSILDDDQVLDCADLLEMPPVYVVGHLVALYTWTFEHRLTGDLTGLSERRIATASQWTQAPDLWVGALRRVGLLVEEHDRLYVANWETTIKHYLEYLADREDAARRKAMERAAQRNGTNGVTRQLQSPPALELNGHSPFTPGQRFAPYEIVRPDVTQKSGDVRPDVTRNFPDVRPDIRGNTHTHEPDQTDRTNPPDQHTGAAPPAGGVCEPKEENRASNGHVPEPPTRDLPLPGLPAPPGLEDISAALLTAGCPGPGTERARQLWRKVCLDLRGAGAAPDEIARRAETFRERYPEWPLEAHRLAARWGACAQPPETPNPRRKIADLGREERASWYLAERRERQRIDELTQEDPDDGGCPEERAGPSD